MYEKEYNLDFVEYDLASFDMEQDLEDLLQEEEPELNIWLVF